MISPFKEIKIVNRARHLDIVDLIRGIRNKN
jgi:hypothetical protein